MFMFDFNIISIIHVSSKKSFFKYQKKNETKQNKTNSHHLVIGEKQKQNVCFISDLFIHEKQNQFVILYRHTHRERERLKKMKPTKTQSHTNMTIQFVIYDCVQMNGKKNFYYYEIVANQENFIRKKFFFFFVNLKICAHKTFKMQNGINYDVLGGKSR